VVVAVVVEALWVEEPSSAGELLASVFCVALALLAVALSLADDVAVDGVLELAEV
jgi:hypothetical protein